MMMIDTLTQADLLFAVGPETEVVRAAGVYACKVKDYRKEMVRPKDGKGEPQEWIVRGELVSPVCLKGKAEYAPRNFERTERSPFLPPPDDAYAWESTYGQITPDGKVLVLLFDEGVTVAVKVIPTASGELDLESVAREAIAIQLTDDKEKKTGILEKFVNKSATTEGKKAALRMLLGIDVEWGKMRRPVEAMLTDTSTSYEMRRYALGIIEYHIVNGRWGEEALDQVKLLCDAYERSQEVKAAVDDLYVLQALLEYFRDGDRWEARKAMRGHLVESIRRRQLPQGSGLEKVRPGLEQEFESLREDVLRSAEIKNE